MLPTPQEFLRVLQGAALYRYKQRKRVLPPLFLSSGAAHCLPTLLLMISLASRSVSMLSASDRMSPAALIPCDRCVWFQKTPIPSSAPLLWIAGGIAPILLLLTRNTNLVHMSLGPGQVTFRTISQWNMAPWSYCYLTFSTVNEGNNLSVCLRLICIISSDLFLSFGYFSFESFCS